MIDKELALRNVIANQALSGLEMTEEEIARSRAILDGDLRIEEAVDEIHRELKRTAATKLPR
jgi:hypothetical protein